MTEILLLFQIQALLEVQPLILVHRILQEICIQIYRTVEEFMIIGTGINFFDKKNQKIYCMYVFRKKISKIHFMLFYNSVSNGLKFF